MPFLLRNNILRIKGTSCRIFFLYDWHIGEKASNIPFIKRYLKEFANTEDAYGVLGGDLMDTTIYGSLGNVHDQQFFVNEQKEILLELLEPVRKRLIGAVFGNHEIRLNRSTTYDITKDICRELEIEYWGADKDFAIQLGKGSFTKFYIHHGIGSGATDGGAANAMVRLHWSSPMADCIVSGHSHKLISFPKEIFYLNSNGKQLVKNQWFVCGGTALGKAEYAKAKAYAPAPIGQQIIEIKRVHATKSATCNAIEIIRFM